MLGVLGDSDRINGLLVFVEVLITAGALIVADSTCGCTGRIGTCLELTVLMTCSTALCSCMCLVTSVALCGLCSVSGTGCIVVIYISSEAMLQCFNISCFKVAASCTVAFFGTFIGAGRSLGLCPLAHIMSELCCGRILVAVSAITAGMSCIAVLGTGGSGHNMAVRVSLSGNISCLGVVAS